MLRTVLLLAATLTTGLMAGLFAAFSYAIMPGLGNADDRTLVITMQRINESIQNALFFVIFFGALIFTVIAGLLFLGADRKAPLIWIGVGLVLYIATLAITIAGNIPLNNLLDAAGDPDRITDLAALRERYEGPWVRLNNLRTITNTLAFAALCWASLISRQL